MARLRARFSSVLNVHLGVYAVVLTNLILYSMSLCGCLGTSPAIPELYVLKARATTGDEVRIGYFGLCTNTTATANVLICNPTTFKSASAIEALFKANNTSSTPSTASLLAWSTGLQSHMLTPLLAASGIFFLLSTLFMLLLRRQYQTRTVAGILEITRFSRRACVLLGQLASTLAIAAAFGTTQSGAALAYANGVVKGNQADNVELGGTEMTFQTGRALVVLQWIIVGLSIVYQILIHQLFDRRRIDLPSEHITPALDKNARATPLSRPDTAGLHRLSLGDRFASDTVRFAGTNRLDSSSVLPLRPKRMSVADRIRRVNGMVGHSRREAASRFSKW